MKADKVKSVPLNVRVTEEHKAALQELAQKSRRELSDYLRLIQEDAIKEQKIV